jgi:hypothetical protein
MSSCCCTGAVLQALVSNNVSLSLRSAVALAAAQQPLSVTQQQQEAVVDFVSRRLEQLLVDSGVSAEAGARCSKLRTIFCEGSSEAAAGSCICACRILLLACGAALCCSPCYQ